MVKLLINLAFHASDCGRINDQCAVHSNFIQCSRRIKIP